MGGEFRGPPFPEWSVYYPQILQQAQAHATVIVTEYREAQRLDNLNIDEIAAFYLKLFLDLFESFLFNDLKLLPETAREILAIVRDELDTFSSTAEADELISQNNLGSYRVQLIRKALENIDSIPEKKLESYDHLKLKKSLKALIIQLGRSLEEVHF